MAKATLNNSQMREEILQQTQKAFIPNDGCYDIGYSPGWFKRVGLLNGLLGIPKRIFIGDAYDSEDMCLEYRSWLIQKHFKKASSGIVNTEFENITINPNFEDIPISNRTSYPALPIFVVEAQLMNGQVSWIIMARTTEGWVYLMYDGTQILNVDRAMIKEFIEIYL